MRTKDSIRVQIQKNTTDMRGISPSMSSYKKLQEENEQLGDELAKLNKPN